MLSALIILFWTVISCLAIGNRPVDACTCSFGLIDVDVNVDIAVDPSLLVPLDETALKRQNTTFKIFGKLCQPSGLGLGIREFMPFK